MAPGAVVSEFIAGPENSLAAYAVCVALADDVPRYNPLVFHGASGTGKSHLALGLAAAWNDREPGATIHVQAASEFAREFADAIETMGNQELAARQRSARLFVLEDLQGLVGKPAAQGEFVRLLDALIVADCQVVVTSRQAPSELLELSAPLRSRLTGGLTVGLVGPGVATRVELLTRFAERRRVKLAAEAAQLLAERLAGTARELAGAVMQLEAVAGREVELPHVQTYLQQQTPPRVPRLAGIAAATARHFVLKVADLQSASRRRQVTQARGVAMYLARTLTPTSLEKIGGYFGRRDHTTVMHACHRIEELIAADLEVQHAVESLRRASLPQSQLQLQPTPTACKTCP